MSQQAHISREHMLKLMLSLESLYPADNESNAFASESHLNTKEQEEKIKQRESQIQELTKLLDEVKVQLEKERKKTEELVMSINVS
jgi:uncharacterized membrane protein YukC